jgi:hypothetical protein
MWRWFDFTWHSERRPTTWKDLVLLLVLAAAGFGLFYPCLACPCGQRPPTNEREFFAWAEDRCPTCDGQGRVTVFKRLW